MKKEIDGEAVAQFLQTLPHVFAKEREAKGAGVGPAELDAAMRRLFKAGRIRLEEYVGAEGGWRVRIVRVP